MDTQTQIERLIELAIVQRGELRKLVGELPQLRDHLNAEIERVFEETEPQLRVELEEFVAKQAQERTDAISAELKAKIDSFAKTLNQSAEAKYSALVAERAKNDDLLKQAEQNIAFAAKALPAQVKEIVTAELARFPRAGEIDQLRKEFAEPKGLNPRGKWSGSETYNRLDLVSYNGDSFVSNTDGNKEKPSRTAAAWTLNAARGVGGGGGGVTSLTDLVPVPSNGQLLIGNGSGFVENTLTAGTGVTITNGAGTITIDASGAQELLTASVVNAESTPITRGQVVYLYSATGFRPSVKLAYNTSDATSAKTFGVVADNSIAAGGIGTVTCVGVVDKLALGSFNDGDTVYLGATAGTITATKPYAPNHLVYVGIIERANNGNGELYVKVQNGYELDEIHDVQITSAPAAGALLMRDATNSLWKANRLSAGTNIAVTNADTSVTIGLTGTVAVANGGTGVTTSTGSGSVVLSTSPSLTTPILGTPQSGTLTTCTGLPISTGVSGLGSNVATFLATPTSTNLRSVVTDETGTGALVFANTPSLVTPDIGAATGASATLTGNANVSDVRLGGTSGPSAKSSIAARAARQGLVFDGTSNGAPISVPAIGTGDFTAAAWVAPTSFPASIFGQSTGVIDLETATTMRVYDGTGAVSYSITIPTVTTGKTYLFTWTRSGTTLTAYVNGVAAGTTTCALSLSAFNYIGSINTFNKLNGLFAGGLLYNRALTAAEVVSLYEAGVPSGADYNTASNTAINTSNWNNSNWPYTSFTGVSSTAFTAVMSTVNIGIAEIIPTPVNGTAGQRIRITVSATLTSGATPTLRLFDASYNTVSNAVALTAGSNTVELVATAAFTKIGFYTSGVTSYAVSSVSVTRLGLLLAPDAAQAGGGLTWYDTSGNAANITLPASGVSWNVPSSLKTASGWTYAGTLTVAPASGTAATAVLSGTAAGSALNYALNGTNKYTAEYVSASDFYAIGRSAVAYDLVMKSGNVLIGTTTDSGAKLQIGTNTTTSAGGAVFGTDVFLYRSTSGYLTLESGLAGQVGFQIKTAGSLLGSFAANATDLYIDARLTGGGIYFRTNGATTALTLDSSQRCILAGALRLNNAYTAGAPTATGYVTLQDSAGNTYKVLVGT